MNTKLSELGELWSMYVEAGRFEVGFRIPCMARWALVYVCGSWPLRRELPFAVWPRGHLATWTFRPGMSSTRG